jgi:hypothetical protein
MIFSTLSFRFGRSRFRFALLTAGLLATVIVIACGSDEPSPAPSSPSGAVVLSDGEIATPTALPAIAVPDEVPAGLEPVWEAYELLVREYVDRQNIDPAELAE